jgi:hypothetical protein
MNFEGSERLTRFEAQIPKIGVGEQKTSARVLVVRRDKNQKEPVLVLFILAVISAVVATNR